MTPRGPCSITRAEYDAIDAVRWSVLKEMRKSPLHYRYRELHEPEVTPAMLLGQGAHTAILEPLQLLSDYVLWENGDRRGNAWKEFEATHTAAGKTILKRNEFELCVAMQQAVRAHAEAAKYLVRGRAEQAIVWIDEETGLVCRARLDWLCDVPGLEVLVDVKSTQSVEGPIFGATAARLGHYAQVAMYLRGLRALGHLTQAKIIAVEQRPPHDVAVFDVGGDELAAGDEEVGDLLRKVKECRERGEWPGRYAAEQPLRLPAWFYASAEADAGGALADLDLAGVEVG